MVQSVLERLGIGLSLGVGARLGFKTSGPHPEPSSDLWLELFRARVCILLLVKDLRRLRMVLRSLWQLRAVESGSGLGLFL